MMSPPHFQDSQSCGRTELVTEQKKVLGVLISVPIRGKVKMVVTGATADAAIAPVCF
jgi:hypothetical protein